MVNTSRDNQRNMVNTSSDLTKNMVYTSRDKQRTCLIQVEINKEHG